MMMHRERVVSGILRPLRPIAFGQKVENRRGSLSPPQRRTPEPRVHPELMTARSGSLSTSIVSASSTMMVGLHFAMLRNRTAPVASTVDRDRGTRKPTRLSSVVLPLLASADVAIRIGLRPRQGLPRWP